MILGVVINSFDNFVVIANACDGFEVRVKRSPNLRMSFIRGLLRANTSPRSDAKSTNPQLRISSVDASIEGIKLFKVGLDIIGWIKRLAEHYFFHRKIKSNGDDGNVCFFGDVIKTSSEFLYFLSGALRCHGENKFIVVVKYLRHLIHHVMTRATLYRITAQCTKEPTVRRFKELALSKKSCFLNSQNTSGSKAYREIPITGMWPNSYDVFF